MLLGCRACLTRLFNIEWKLETVSLDWQTGVVGPVFKKGAWRTCFKFKGSHSLLGKVYARVLDHRIHSLVEAQILEKPCGFRPGHGTLEQFHHPHKNTRGFMGVCTTMYSMNLEKVYNHVPHGFLWWGCFGRIGYEVHCYRASSP